MIELEREITPVQFGGLTQGPLYLLGHLIGQNLRKGVIYMGFGFPFVPIPPILALFDTFPIGTPLQIGMDAGFWRGAFGGIQDGVALLTNALLHSNIGTPIDGIRPVVRIPIRAITFVSQ